MSQYHFKRCFVSKACQDSIGSKKTQFCQTIWRKFRPIYFRNHRICLIWHHMTCGYLINSKDRSRDTVSNPLKRFNVIRCALCRPSRKSTIRTVLKIGKKRWHKCIVSEGNYFRGDEIDLEE